MQPPFERQAVSAMMERNDRKEELRQRVAELCRRDGLRFVEAELEDKETLLFRFDDRIVWNRKGVLP